MNLNIYYFQVPELKTAPRGENLATQLWWVIVRSRLCVGHEMLWPEIYAGILKQKCNRDDKERC